MKCVNGLFVFESGKERSFNCGIAGLTPNLELTEGYDSYVHTYENTWSEWSKYKLTAEEMVELGEHMIDRWEQFVSKHKV